MGRTLRAGQEALLDLQLSVLEQQDGVLLGESVGPFLPLLEQLDLALQPGDLDLLPVSLLSHRLVLALQVCVGVHPGNCLVRLDDVRDLLHHGNQLMLLLVPLRLLVRLIALTLQR